MQKAQQRLDKRTGGGESGELKGGEGLHILVVVQSIRRDSS